MAIGYDKHLVVVRFTVSGTSSDDAKEKVEHLLGEIFASTEITTPEDSLIEELVKSMDISLRE